MLVGRNIQAVIAIGICAWTGCATTPKARLPNAPPQSAEAAKTAPSLVNQADRAIQPVSLRKPPGVASSRRSRQSPPEPIATGEGVPSGDGREHLPIDLPTALRLANADNLQVAVAREQIRQAFAKVDAANVLWLPVIRGGTSYNRHDGSIQSVAGDQFNTDRGALYAGLGGGIYGAGTPILPGAYANFSLADAFLQPLAARQFAAARGQAATAVTNDTLLAVAQAYLELLRAEQDQSIAQEIASRTDVVAKLTADYARAGEGLQADADRLRVESSFRKNDVYRTGEARQVAATRLAQLLRIDPTVALEPVEPTVVPIELVPENVELRELVAQGLSRRPELAENRYLVAEATSRLRRERFAPLVPSVLLGTSYGAMGAGIGGSLAPATGRLDVDAVAYWQVRGLGLGDRAAQNDARSVVRQARLRQVAMMDQVAREITEAHAQAQARRLQINIAREGVQAAIDSYRRNLARIEEVKGLPIEVLQSVQALATARREYLRTLIDYNLAQFALHRALGWPGGTASVPSENAYSSG